MTYKIVCGGILVAALLTTLGSCRTSGVQQSTGEKEHTEEVRYERGNLLILFTDARQAPSALETEFEQYQLKNEGLASRSQPKYSFSFNIAKIGAEEIIQLLNTHATVREATFVSPGQ